MANWVKLSSRWINLDRVGSADDEDGTIRLNADLAQGQGRISRGYSGEDGATLRGVLNALSANVATSAAAPDAGDAAAGMAEPGGSQIFLPDDETD